MQPSYQSKAADQFTMAARNLQDSYFKALSDSQTAWLEAVRQAHAGAVKLGVTPASQIESAKFEQGLLQLKGVLDLNRKALEALVAI
jgi:hypothetical protein